MRFRVCKKVFFGNIMIDDLLDIRDFFWRLWLVIIIMFIFCCGCNGILEVNRLILKMFGGWLLGVRLGRRMVVFNLIRV